MCVYVMCISSFAFSQACTRNHHVLTCHDLSFVLARFCVFLEQLQHLKADASTCLWSSVLQWPKVSNWQVQGCHLSILQIYPPLMKFEELFVLWTDFLPRNLWIRFTIYLWFVALVARNWASSDLSHPCHWCHSLHRYEIMDNADHPAWPSNLDECAQAMTQEQGLASWETIPINVIHPP